MKLKEHTATHNEDHEPQKADTSTSAAPGSDWIYVEEGEELTAEQAARKFLSLSWEQQAERMGRFLDDSGAAAACHRKMP